MKNPKIINEETFALETPVTDIPAENALELDGYLFDAKEIIQMLDHNQTSILTTNPHNNAAFSQEAQDTMRAHPLLVERIGSEEEKQKNREEKIKRFNDGEIVSNMVEMLTAVNTALTETGAPEIGLQRAQVAVAEFTEYVSSLSKDLQNSLYNYNIHRPLIGGGNQNMFFRHALLGSGTAGYCVQTLQIALWQFVIHFNPTLPVPTRIKQLAQSQHFLIPTTAPNIQPINRIFDIPTNIYRRHPHYTFLK